MKKIIYLFIWMMFSVRLAIADNTWIFGNTLTEDKIRNWNIHTDDIPNILKSAIDFFMWIAWTIAIIFIIIWAYQMLFWSLEKDISKWRNTVIFALWWFVLAASSWVIIRLVLDNFNF